MGKSILLMNYVNSTNSTIATTSTAFAYFNCRNSHNESNISIRQQLPSSTEMQSSQKSKNHLGKQQEQQHKFRRTSSCSITTPSFPKPLDKSYIQANRSLTTGSTNQNTYSSVPLNIEIETKKKDNHHFDNVDGDRRKGRRISIESYSWQNKNILSSNNDLRQIPSNYQLDPSSLRIRNIPLSGISSRICNFMKDNSISCYYHNYYYSGIVQVDCTTSNLNKFVIRLWNGGSNDDDSSDDIDDNNGGIIVEVQRRRGCSYEMCKIRRSIYKAILMNNINKNRGSKMSTTGASVISPYRPSKKVREMFAKRMAIQQQEKKKKEEYKKNNHKRKHCSTNTESKMTYSPTSRPLCDTSMGGDNPTISALVNTRSDNRNRDDIGIDVIDTLQTSLNLLRSTCTDENILGMESLYELTNSKSVCVSSETTRATCQYLLLLLLSSSLPTTAASSSSSNTGNDDDRSVTRRTSDVKTDIRDIFLTYLTNIERPSASMNDDELDYYYQNNISTTNSLGIYNISDENDQELHEYERGHSFGWMHNLLLQVIDNILLNMAKTNAAAKILNNSEVSKNEEGEAEEETLMDILLKALLYNISVYNYRQHEASISVKIINTLLEDNLISITDLLPLVENYKNLSRGVAAIRKSYSLSSEEYCEVELDVKEDLQLLTSFVELLIKANNHGKLYHSNLEIQTQTLLDMLKRKRQ